MIGGCSGTHISSQGISAFFVACSDERRFAKRAPKVRCSERTADCFALLKIYFGRSRDFLDRDRNVLEFRRELSFAAVDKQKNRRKLDRIRTESRLGICVISGEINGVPEISAGLPLGNLSNIAGRVRAACSI
jgi:hypothetical protein